MYRSLVLLFVFVGVEKISTENNVTTMALLNISKPSADSITILNPLNCTPYIPQAAFQIMQSYSQKLHANNQSDSNTIPYAYLINCILNSQYDKRVSPLTYSNTPQINIDFALAELIGLQFDGDLTFLANFHLNWLEPRITWSLESDIEFWNWLDVTFPISTYIWLPILRVLNCAGDQCSVIIDNSTTPMISYTGQVDIYFSNILESTCQLNLLEFPFDIQNCSLILCLNNDDAYATVSLVPGLIDYADYHADSLEWTIASFDISNDSNFDVFEFVEYSPTNWTSTRMPASNDNSGSGSPLIIRITLARNSAIYVYNLLVPLFVIVMIAIVAVVYPASQPEKPVMLIHVLLAFTIYQLLLNDKNPQSKELPYIGIYIMLSMALTGMNQFSSSLVLRLHHMSTNSQPPAIICILLIRPISLTMLNLKSWLRPLYLKIRGIKSVNLDSEGV